MGVWFCSLFWTWRLERVSKITGATERGEKSCDSGGCEGTRVYVGSFMCGRSAALHSSPCPSYSLLCWASQQEEGGLNKASDCFYFPWLSRDRASSGMLVWVRAATRLFEEQLHHSSYRKSCPSSLTGQDLSRSGPLGLVRVQVFLRAGGGRGGSEWTSVVCPLWSQLSASAPDCLADFFCSVNVCRTWEDGGSKMKKL